MTATDDRTLRERLRDNDEVLAEMKAICSGDWKPEPGMVLGLLARASVVLAATTDRLARTATVVDRLQTTMGEVAADLRARDRGTQRGLQWAYDAAGKLEGALGVDTRISPGSRT